MGMATEGEVEADVGVEGGGVDDSKMEGTAGSDKAWVATGEAAEAETAEAEAAEAEAAEAGAEAELPGEIKSGEMQNSQGVPPKNGRS